MREIRIGHTDDSGARTTFKERARTGRIEHLLIMASFFCGFGVMMMKSVVGNTVYILYAKATLSRYISTEGYIDSIQVSGSTRENYYDEDFYGIDYRVRYSVGKKDFEADIHQLEDSLGRTLSDLGDVWETLSIRAPSQAISGYNLHRGGCEFFAEKYLRSEIKTPIEVRYDPKHPGHNNWLLTQCEDSWFFRFFLALFILILTGGSVFAVTRYRSPFSKILNLGVVVFSGFFLMPRLGAIGNALEAAFPKLRDPPHMLIQFDERLDPKVCKDLF